MTTPRVLILGGSGMLGHKLWQEFHARFDTYATVRSTGAAPALLDPSRTVANVSAETFESVVGAVESLRPDVVVNCIGIVKQAAEAHDPIASIIVNSLFPHRLAELCRAVDARLIHVSTDCVFSGRVGAYSESDLPDPEDLYGRSKLLGEVAEGECLTIRTSIIGRELERSNGLLEWFLSNEGGTIRGFRRAIFSGFTTIALARILASVVAEHRGLSGLRHVAAEPISKFDLLVLLKCAYNMPVEILPDDEVVCDRSLDGSMFEHETGLRPPRWPEMIAELARETTPYGRLRT